jgi:phage host-nuclease inhibitor protein Gam
MAKKPTFPIYRTSDEAAIALAHYGSLERQIAGIESEFSERVAELRKEVDEKIGPLQGELALTLLGLQEFANQIRPTLPSKKQKTIDLSTGELGWRTGNPSVSLKAKTALIIERIKSLGKEAAKKYIRTKEGLDKQALLKDRPAIEGIKYSQGRERFYVTARSDTGETKAVIESA